MKKVNLLNTVLTTGQALDVVVQGNYAYVANDFDGLRIYDVTDPCSPLTTQSKAIYTGGRTSGVSVSGVICVVAVNKLGILIFDVTIPTTPVLLYQIDKERCGICHDVLINGNYLYSSGDKGVMVWNISVPTSPTKIATLICEGQLAIDSNRLYVANGVFGFAVYDISTPSDPTIVRSGAYVLSTGYSTDIFVDENYIYVALREDGVKIHDKVTFATVAHITTVLPLPSVPGQWPIDGEYGVALSVIANDNKLYVSNFGRGLTVYDISDISNITEIKTILSVELPCGLAVLRDYIYWANGLDGLKIIQGKYKSYEVTYTVAPNNLVDGSVTVEQTDYSSAAILSAGFPSECLLENQVLSTADEPYRRNVGSVPPYVVGRIWDGGICSSILIENNQLYVANTFDGVRIYSITNPTAIAQTNRLLSVVTDVLPVVKKVIKYGNYLYSFSNVFCDVRVWDLSVNPIVYKGRIVLTTGFGTDAVLKDNYLIVSSNRGAVKIYNLTTLVLTTPTTTSSLPIYMSSIPEYPIVKLRVFENYLFVMYGANGLKIYDISTITAPVLLTTLNLTDARDCWYRSSDKTLFVANGDLGLNVYDVSTIATPVLLKTEVLGGGCLNVTNFSDKRLCISTWARLLDINISDRTTPTILGEYDCGQYINECHVVNGILYAVFQDGIKVYSNNEIESIGT